MHSGQIDCIRFNRLIRARIELISERISNILKTKYTHWVFMQSFRISCSIWGLLLRYSCGKINFLISISLWDCDHSYCVISVTVDLFFLAELAIRLLSYHVVLLVRNKTYLRFTFYHILKGFGVPCWTYMKSHINLEIMGFDPPWFFVKLDPRAVGFMPVFGRNGVRFSAAKCEHRR